MNIAAVKSKAAELFAEIGFIGHIHDENEYEQALELVDALIEDYDTYQPLIDVLAISIERWENEADAFSEFNQNIANLDDGAAVLITLKDQYKLKADDLQAVMQLFPTVDYVPPQMGG